MKRILRYKVTLIVVGLLAIAAAAIAGWRFMAEPAPTYRVLTVTRGDLEVTVIATGVVQPSNRLEIKPPIAGRVEQVLVREGQRVRRGQILAWLSSSERATLIDAARAKGEEELKRWEELYRPTPIIAPIDGTLILRNAEPGQTYQVQEAMFAMSDRLIVRAQVDETDIAQIKLHQAARITLDAYADKPIDGKVNEIAFEAKTVNNVTTYGVDVLPTRVPDFMRSGMTANVNFVTQTRQNVLLVPTEAVRTREGRTGVVMADRLPDGKPNIRRVEVGMSDGRRTEVVSGLDEGDKVIASNVTKPSAGRQASSPFAPSGFGGRR